MITKKEQVHIDIYDERGIKTMDAHGLYDFDELSTELVKALAHKKIPVIRRAKAGETVDEGPDAVCFAEEVLSMKWRFDGVEFAAEGPAEYVLRASAELLEYLEALT